MVAPLVLIGIGILTLALSLPMYLGKVKRNKVYGFRTALTLSSDDVWYPANCYAAVTMMIWSVIMLALGVALLFFLPLSSTLEMIMLFFPLTILIPCLISIRWTRKRFGAAG